MGTPVTSLVTATESVDQKTSQNFVPAAKTTTARVYKNLIAVGVMLLLSYASTAPTVILVTSVAGETLGNITFCLNYVLSCLFNFVSIPLLGIGASKKKVMIIGNACLVGFSACNWYVSYYTLIPGAVLFGSGVALVWVASLMYTSKIAIDHGERCNLPVKGIIRFFTGIVMALTNTGYVVGSATAAGVLTLLKHDMSYHNITDSIGDNFTTSDEECLTNDDKLEIGFVTTNILRGIIFFYSLLALAVIVFFLDDIDGHRPHVSTHVAKVLSGFFKTQWQDLVAIMKVFIKKEMTLSCLRCFALGASVSFMFARFTKTYVAECVGVHVVGYAIMLYGIGGTLGSFISGKLLALKTKWLIILGTLFIHLIVITFLVIWDREPILLLLLFISLAWGTCDGSWITICNSFAATYFKEEETRYTFALQFIVFQFGMGSAALLSLVTSVEVNLIIIGVMFLISVPLHQTVVHCSKPPVQKMYELPVFYVDNN